MITQDIRFMATPQALPANTFVFICGLHRGGTSLFFRILKEHPQVSGFKNTGVLQDEGQFLQSVYLPARAYGGPGKFGFDPAAHLTENSTLVTESNREKLLQEWAPHWDTSKPFLIEKSPPNLIRSRFLQAMFDQSKFIVLRRHPIPVALATQKWSKNSLYSLIRHWIVCHQIWESDKPFIKHYIEIKYEQLLADPLNEFNRICSFIGLDPFSNLSLKVDSSFNERYFATWAALKRKPRMWPYITLIEQLFERSIQRWGYSFFDEK